MDMEQVPRVSGREAVELLLRCWCAAVGLSWTGCRLAWLWPRWSLLLPQASRYLLAGYARGHGGCCPSGCRLCSTPGSSRCGHRSLKNWLWWLRAEDVTAGQRNKIKILDAVVNLTITEHKTEWTFFFFLMTSRQSCGYETVFGIFQCTQVLYYHEYKSFNLSDQRSNIIRNDEWKATATQC